MKKIYRSTRERILGGVAAGMADYFDVDVALTRLLWVLFIFMGGIGLPAYIVAWIIIPEEPYPGAGRDSRTRNHITPQSGADRAGSSSRVGSPSPQSYAGDSSGAVDDTTESASGGNLGSSERDISERDGLEFNEQGSSERSQPGRIDPVPEDYSRDRTNQAFGILLVVFGAVFLFRETFHLDIFRYVWPVLLILLGVYVLINDRRGS